LNAQPVFYFVVEGRQVLVCERPIGDVRAVDRAVERPPPEVLTPEARHLRIPVDGPAADGRRQRADVADERARCSRGGLGLTPCRARLERRVLVLECASGLHFVVRERDVVNATRRAEAGEQIAALFQHEYLVARTCELPRSDAAARTGANDD